MAILKGEFGDEICELEIKPFFGCKNASNNLEDYYEVKFDMAGVNILNFRYNLLNSDNMAHFWVFELSYIFQLSWHLLTEKLSFCSNPHEEDVNHRKSIQINADAEWMHAILQGKRKLHSKIPGSFSVIECKFYIQTNFSDDVNKVCTHSNFVKVQFVCLPQDAQQFGRDLEGECREVESLRDSYV